MNKTLLFSLFALTPLAANALPDDFVRFEAPVRALLYHARSETSSIKTVKFSVFWNYESDSTHTRADIAIGPRGEADFHGEVECEYKIIRCQNGRDSIITVGDGVYSTEGSRDNGFSAILSVNVNGAQLSMGGNEPEVFTEVPFSASKPGAIGAKSSADDKLLTNLLISEYSAPEPSPEEQKIIAQAKQLFTEEGLQALNNSSPTLQQWEYLDRNIDPSKATNGSTNNLATITDGDGGFYILQIADDITLKGHMKPTNFIDNYDLEWRTADGRLLRGDVSATFESGGAILRFDFPLLSSSLRYRRRLANS